MSGCHEPAPATEPSDLGKPDPAPRLSEVDEALLVSLASDDPGDFFDDRAQLWRIGALRWQAGQPEIQGRPEDARSLAQPLPLIVIDPVGPRVLLPLDLLEWRPPPSELVRSSAIRAEDRSPVPIWRSIRLTAVVSPGDLVSGLRRDLAPTPWLELDAGIPLTPVDRDGERLRVTWDDPQCGFGLALTIDPEQFGPLHPPSPTTSTPEPEPNPTKPATHSTSLSLQPSTAIYETAEAKAPLLRLHPATMIDPDGPGWIGQVITRSGSKKRGRTPISLQCNGVAVRGWVETKNLHESPGRYAVVEQAEPPAPSRCAETREASSMVVPAGTVLYAGDEPTMVGVVVGEIEMGVRIENKWMRGCVPSPWGDLEVRFRGAR